MEANTVRIILFVAGILVIAGIYLFDRARKRRPRAPGLVRREPGANGIGGRGEPRPEAPDTALRGYREPLSDEELRAADLALDDETPAGRIEPEWNPDEEDLLVAAAEDPDLPTLIVQIHIIAPEGHEFHGGHLFAAAREVGLAHGDMRIFHRIENTPRGPKTLFSMANLVEPGVFEPDQARHFSTPGLVLFTQLPVAKDGLAVFSDMLFTAERLAAALGGDLYDETHVRLSKQAIADTRDRILEHRRQLQRILGGR